jgi:hypothetical protein
MAASWQLCGEEDGSVSHRSASRLSVVDLRGRGLRRARAGRPPQRRAQWRAISVRT